MGIAGSRPSCLGEKNPPARDFLVDSYLKGPGLEGGSAVGRNNGGGRAGAPPVGPPKPALSPARIENGWSASPRRSCGPLPKRSNAEAEGRQREEGRPQRIWKPFTTTEITEVTETVVTEIVEVTEFPRGGHRSREPVMAVVKVLSGCAGALPQVAALLGDPWSTERAQETLNTVLNWSQDVEHLMAAQKAPSSEVKVLEAQLQEQKLLKLLLDDRMSQLERLLQEKQTSTSLGHEMDTDLISLQEKWTALVQEAETRRGCLEQVLSAAHTFQGLVDSFQDWLSLTERKLAELWSDPSTARPIQEEANQQTRELCEEIRVKSGDLDHLVAHGQQLLELLSGEESQLVQEKMDSLQMRLLLVSQSGADIPCRLQGAQKSSSRQEPTQEALSLWLGRMEKILPPQGSRAGAEPVPVSTADQEKFQWALDSELSQASLLGKCLEGQDPISLDANSIHLQLASHKQLAAEILHHYGLVERLVAIADPLLRCCPEDVQLQLQALVWPLQGRMEHLVQQSSACSLCLEKAQVLLAQYREAHEELSLWLGEAQQTVAQFPPHHTVSCEAFREQQVFLQGLREAIAEHKPLLAKLQRVSQQLAELSPEEAIPFQQGWQLAEEQYGSVREQVHQAAAVLEEAIPRYSQLSERMELMVECVARLQSCMRHFPATRGDPAWFREQLRVNSLWLAELEKLGVALETLRGQGAELLATVQTSSSQAIQDRVEQLLQQWKELWQQGEERENWLQGLLVLADRFWDGLSNLSVTLSDTQQVVLDLEEVPWDVEAIQARVGTMQALREEIDSLQGDLDSLSVVGMELVSSCGSSLDKPDVTKSLDNLYWSWNSLSRVWAERQTHLQEQLQAALRDQEMAERLSSWLVAAELRIAEDFQVGGDLDMVKKQLLELKDFKQELYQCKVDAESLRHLRGPTATGSRSPPSALSTFCLRWSNLEEEVVSQQHQLEATLLSLGQFQSQLQELLQWLQRTSEQLRGTLVLSLDLQGCEIELAKHKVLRTDILSRARTVESVKEAGQALLLSSSGDPVDRLLQGQLQQLNQGWDFLLEEVERHQLQLENNLSQVQDVTLEMTELLQWLDCVEVHLSFRRLTWGQPEAAKDMLGAHLELCREKDSKQPTYDRLREQVRGLLAAHPLTRASGTEHSLSILEQKWENVAGQLQHRKEQLSEGLAVTTEFQATIQELLKWVGCLEESLENLPSPSYVLETVTAQIQEQKTLLQEIEVQSERLADLEATATHVKVFGWKQDCSLVLSVRERLVKGLQDVSKRGAALDEARRQAKQFSESQQLLLNWLDEVDPALELPAEAADTTLSQERVKGLLAKHKEFQRKLRAKRPIFEATLRGGHLLREKAALPEDVELLGQMLGELKERWEALFSRATERQQKLEEALLFSGHIMDALQALLDWLCCAELQLAEETPVAGDRDLVSSLMEQHKGFQKELGQRASCVKALRLATQDLVQGCSLPRSQWLQSQVEELDRHWELVCCLSVSKQVRLEAALSQAEEFQQRIRLFLERLEAHERSTVWGACPDDEGAVQEFLRQLQELRQDLQSQQPELERISFLGEEMLSVCHPDALIAIHSWVALAKSRFQEVQNWAQQHNDRLQTQLASLAAEQEAVVQLVDWIGAAEEALAIRNKEAFPEDAGQLEELVCQHAVFMEELSRKQVDVEKVTKDLKHQPLAVVPTSHRRPSRRRGASRCSQRAPTLPVVDLEPPSPALAQLVHRWQQLWLLALDRQYRLQNAQRHLREQEDFAHFDFAIWRKRYMQWISQKKSRTLDVFRGIDRDQDGRITQKEFVESVLSSKFPTSSLEMSSVASIFDVNGDGFIDYYEFVSTLHPSRDMLRKTADAEQIQDEVNRQVAQCSCAKRFQVEQISANRYRFGESQQLRMVRILRSTLMVRVGGGWIALDEFLVKNDPCRVKGRTNLKINEKYLSPELREGKGRGSWSAPTSKPLSPSRSVSSLCSSASAPSSPLARKPLPRLSRSEDRGLPSHSSQVVDVTELVIASAPKDATGGEAAFTDPPRRAPSINGAASEPEAQSYLAPAQQPSLPCNGGLETSAKQVTPSSL